MKRLINTISLSLSFLLLSGLLLPVALAQESPITISLLNSKASYLSSDPIHMQVSILNGSGADIIAQKGFFNQKFYLMITFTDPDGKPVFTKYQDIGYEGGPLPRYLGKPAALVEVIPAGAKKTQVIDDARAFYDLSKYGRFTAQVFTFLETYSDYTTDPVTGDLFASLDGRQAFSPASNKVSFEVVSPTAGGLSITMPNGGEVLPSGGIFGICWKAPSTAVKFDLIYSTNNGTSWNPIGSVTGLNCANWAIPVVVGNKTQCLIKVIGYNSAGGYIGEDSSDNPFTIDVLRVLSPNGGENLKSGSTLTITWQTHKTTNPVALTELGYKTATTNWKIFRRLAGNPGSLNIVVPNVPAPKQFGIAVRLKDASGNVLGMDKSDGAFTIVP